MTFSKLLLFSDHKVEDRQQPVCQRFPRLLQVSFFLWQWTELPPNLLLILAIFDSSKAIKRCFFCCCFWLFFCFPKEQRPFFGPLAFLKMISFDALSRLTDFERETMENMFESQFLRSQQVLVPWWICPNKMFYLSKASNPRPPPLPAVFRAPSIPSMPTSPAGLSQAPAAAATLSVEERAVILARTHLLQVPTLIFHRWP